MQIFVLKINKERKGGKLFKSKAAHMLPVSTQQMTVQLHTVPFNLLCLIAYGVIKVEERGAVLNLYSNNKK